MLGEDRAEVGIGRLTSRTSTFTTPLLTFLMTVIVAGTSPIVPQAGGLFGKCSVLTLPDDLFI